ncbi:MAG: right-handed parallel beta-helix repeat-containing protein [Nitrospirota bacterium]
MRMKIWLVVLISLATLSLVIVSCGGGGGGGGGSTGGETLVTLSSVTALYPNNGVNWNDYVKGGTITTAMDTLCTAATDTACLHGGEVKVVTVTGKTSCSGLTASDALGAFDWTCDASTGTVRMISTGLKDGKFLSDLIDFTTPAWKANSVTVNDNGTLYSTQTSTMWWTNPVTTAISGGSLAAAGTVYAVTTSMTGTYTIDASKVALVSRPGVTIQGAAAAGETIISASNVNFIWLEGTINAIGNNLGVYLDTVKYSSLRNVKADNADTGTYLAGVVLNASSNNTLKNISGVNNGQYAIELVGANGNMLAHITAANNGSRGVALAASRNNIVKGVRTSNNGGAGIYLVNNCYDNVFLDIVATSSFNGIDIADGGSSNNVLSGIAVALNANDGIDLRSSDNLLMNIMSIREGSNGLVLMSGARNTVANIASADGSWDIYSLNSSTNTFTGIVKVGSSGCVVNGGVDPGITNGTCAMSGSSDAALTTGVTLTGSVLSKVTSTDVLNASNASGTESYANITDWTTFANDLRAWGNDGIAFPDYSNTGRCVGTCRIWDWSLRSTDTVVRDVLSKPTGNDTITHTWSDASTTTFLRNAVELSGNGNGLCESGETCLYTPNIGAYQGHGNLVSAGTFTDGTITGVTLLKYETNGR